MDTGQFVGYNCSPEPPSFFLIKCLVNTTKESEVHFHLFQGQNSLCSINKIDLKS